MTPPAAPLEFTLEPMREIRERLEHALERQSAVRFRVPNPDLAPQLYPGEIGPAGRHHPYQTWLDLAERLECHFLTPTLCGDQVELHFQKVRPSASPAPRPDPAGDFSRVDKLEDPCFLEDYTEALERLSLGHGARVLSVGVNRGDELRPLAWVYPQHALEVVGLDRDVVALEQARARFPAYTFLERDLNALPDPLLGRFELIVALGVLQSSGLEQDRVFRTLLREHLAPGGSLIVGLPNCRYEGGRITYGARMLNFRKPDLSLLLGDLALYRRYLHKHGFRVFVTGKYEVLLTAVPV